MLYAELEDGQGLGAQLWIYATTRALASRRGLDFKIFGVHRFKGMDFLDLDFGEGKASQPLKEITEREEYLRGTWRRITRPDPRLFAVQAGTKISGNLLGMSYISGFESATKEWIKPKNDLDAINLPENTCVVHLRGGDFSKILDVFVPSSYYKKSMRLLKRINPLIEFKCVTDDPDVARRVLGDIEIIGSARSGKIDKRRASHHGKGDAGEDFLILMASRYAIIPNSSFSWWATFLSATLEFGVGPKYWSYHNVSNGYWSSFDMVSPHLQYLDRRGKAQTASDCLVERERWEESHIDDFQLSPTPPSIARKALIRSNQEFRALLRGF